MDSLAPEVVAPRLRGRFGRPYVFEEKCESTQLLLLDTDFPEGAVAVAEHQTRGRGRHGRQWLAPARSSLLFSLLLRPPLERRVPELSLVAALAVAEAVEQTTGSQARVKWPNDVLLDGRKVAGILAELRSGAVVVGIGVNVSQTDEELPRDAPTPPGSLRSTTGATVDRADLLVAILGRLEGAYDTWRREGLGALHDGIASRDALRGRVVVLDGRELTARGILPDGRLETQTADGEVLALDSGEVQLDRP